MTVAHPRALRHPGPIQPERITALSAPARASFRLEIAANARLDEAIVRPLGALGVESAIFTILSGPWAAIGYCTGVPDPTGHRVATYAAPLDVTDVLLVAGSATLGLDVQGRPLVHAHGSFVDGSGALRGGHLVPNRCHTGTVPTIAYVTIIEGFAVRQIADPETNHFTYQPVAPADRARG